MRVAALPAVLALGACSTSLPVAHPAAQAVLVVNPLCVMDCRATVTVQRYAVDAATPGTVTASPDMSVTGTVTNHEAGDPD